MSGTRVGDGLALGEDLVLAAERAVVMALAPLRGARADLACVFVSGGEPDAAAAALARAAERLDAHTVVGCTAHGVMAAGKGVEGVGSVSVWAAVLPGVSLRGFHLEVIRTSDSIAVLGMPERRDDDVVGVLLADPWSFPADGFVGSSTESLRRPAAGRGPRLRGRPSRADPAAARRQGHRQGCGRCRRRR